MSTATVDVIPPSDRLISETDMTVADTGVRRDEEETWFYGADASQAGENMDNPIVPSIAEIARHEIDGDEDESQIPPVTSLSPNRLGDDSDDDDDGIQVTIGNYELEASTFANNRLKNRGMLPGGPVVPQVPPPIRGVNIDAQGVINGQATFEHDLPNAYKDEEKPWKKPGSDITDYFNYGFTEETWAQYSERQRRLRYENSLARSNPMHMPPMYPGHPVMMHSMNPHPGMMMNRPPHPSMMVRPMNTRRSDGRIDVIGATDQTSRRSILDTPDNSDHPPFINGYVLSGGLGPNGPAVGTLHPGPPTTNGTPPGATRHISTLGAQRPPMMSVPFRPGYGHAPGGPHFFPRGPAVGLPGDRLPRPYFIPRHPQPWNNGIPSIHGFPPGSVARQGVDLENSNDPRSTNGRGSTPRNRSSRSPTPEERRPLEEGGSTSAATEENTASTKEDQYKDRYRDDRDHHFSSRHRPPSKERSSSSSYHARRRGSEHEYERPRGDRRSSRDHDDTYGSSSRKRHRRADDEPSRSQRSSRRTPSKREPSPSEKKSSMPTSTDSSRPAAEPSQTSELNPSSSPGDHSRHTQQKKSSKRSRRDSSSERSSSRHHRRRSKEKSSSSGNKKSKNQSEPLADLNQPTTE